MADTIRFAPVLKTILVKAPQDRAFEVFVAYRWAPKSHSLLRARTPQQEVVIEPRLGGRWFERGEDGSECDWGRVLLWEPPHRVILAWEINGRFEPDPGARSEVEVRFVAEGPSLTRVELEHRGFEAAGETAEGLRRGVDSPNGWGRLLQIYAAAAAS